MTALAFFGFANGCEKSLNKFIREQKENMSRPANFEQKFESYRNLPLYRKLDKEQQTLIEKIAATHYLTFQEFRQVVEAARDLAQWGENELSGWWQNQASQSTLKDIPLKKHLLKLLQVHLETIKSSPKAYPSNGFAKLKKRDKKLIVTETSQKKIYGMCPVASPKTVCCNLRTIDAVENCVFGCSYCSIQTFYSDKIVLDEDFGEKLQKITLDKNRFYHFGTGQSSDSLALGNKNGNLEALLRFAEKNPNVLLEFKTKSNNISFFLKNDIPPNIVCSWSLNTQVIIDNEEHFTASLDQRLKAARAVAGQGIKTAFHFHPMIYYLGWKKDYTALGLEILKQFTPEEVLFISFGSVTLIKPAIKKIRSLGHPTKILQMTMVTDPHGKFTYPDDLKIEMFKTMYQVFSPWHDRIFFYLCMEKESIWEKSLGYCYESNEDFEKQFGLKTMNKLKTAISY